MNRLKVNYDIDDQENNDNILDIDGLQQLWGEFGVQMDARRALPLSEKYIESDHFLERSRAWAKFGLRKENKIILKQKK